MTFDNAGIIAQDGARDIGWQAFGPALAVTILATIVVAMRWYTRWKIAKCPGWDDFVIFLSLALSIAMTVTIGVAVYKGIGRYTGLGDEDHNLPSVDIAKLVVVMNALWVIVVNTTKVSLLIQYLRVFRTRTIRWLCFGLLFTLLPTLCWGWFGGIFICSPTSKLWRPESPGRCMDARSYWFSAAGIDIGLDFITLMLPIPAISSLRLPRKQKIGLWLVFSLGFVVCVVSIVRVVTVLIWTMDGDTVAAGIWAIIWSSVEANVGICCASLLTLKPLVVKLCPGLMGERSLPKHCTTLPMMEAGPEGSADAQKAFSRLTSTSSVDNDQESPRRTRINSKTDSLATPRASKVEERGTRGPNLPAGPTDSNVVRGSLEETGGSDLKPPRLQPVDIRESR